MANYCDSPFDGDTRTHDIDLLNELQLQIFMASITLETATNMPEGNEPNKKILPYQTKYKNICHYFFASTCRRIWQIRYKKANKIV